MPKAYAHPWQRGDKALRACLADAENKGITKADFCAAMNMTYPTLKKRTSSPELLTLADLRQICKLCDLTGDELAEIVGVTR